MAMTGGTAAKGLKIPRASARSAGRAGRTLSMAKTTGACFLIAGASER